MKRVLVGTMVLLSLFAFSARTTFRPAGDPFRQEVLSRINALRTQGCYCGMQYMPPVAPVTWNESLEISAFNHAADMSNKRYFSHYSLDGRRLRERNIEAGYTFTGFQSFRIGENIAHGQRTIREVMRDWTGSPDHCRNLMDPDFQEVGLAVVNSYWVQDFGVRMPAGSRMNYTAREPH